MAASKILLKCANRSSSNSREVDLIDMNLFAEVY